MREQWGKVGEVRFRHFPRVTVALVVAAGIILWVYGSSYYRLPVASRPDDPLHQFLGPARPLGHGLGIVGGWMLLAILLYSLRKRVRRLQRLGALRHWLTAHIFLGLMGPLLVTFHTGFKFGGLVAIAYWSMVVTMLSGIFGRYIYIQIPHHTTPGALQGMREEADRLERELRERLGGYQELLVQVIYSVSSGQEGDGRALLGLMRQDFGRLVRRWRLRRLLRARTDLERGEIRRIVRLAQGRAVALRRLAMAAAMERVFHYWHVFHRPFVWIMFAIAALHVGVALFFGYTWLYEPSR